MTTTIEYIEEKPQGREVRADEVPLWTRRCHVPGAKSTYRRTPTMESNEVVLTNEENGHRSYVKPEQIVTLLDEAPEPQKVTVEDLAKRKGCFWGGGTLWMLSGASSGAESEWLEATGLDGKREGERDGFHRASIVTPVRVEIRVYGPPGFRGGE